MKTYHLANRPPFNAPTYPYTTLCELVVKYQYDGGDRIFAIYADKFHLANEELLPASICEKCYKTYKQYEPLYIIKGTNLNE